MMSKFKSGLSVQELGPAGAAYVRAHAGKPAGQPDTVIHLQTHLDGKLLAASVTKHQARAANMPNAIGAHDSYGSYFPPGGTMVGT